MSGALHLLGGKPGAGKSTFAARLAEGGVLLSEDALIAALYPGEVGTMRAYMERGRRVRAALEGAVVGTLRAGATVVLDFQANTVASRAWMRGLAEAGGAEATLHWVAADDATCLARLAARAARGEHPFAPTPEAFAAVVAHVVPPTPDEGFAIVRHGAEG